MSKEEVAAYRARQKAAGLVQATVWVKPEGKAALQALADQINAGKTPLPGAGPATQPPTATPNPFSMDLKNGSWRQYSPYLRPAQLAFLEGKEAKPTLSVPSERPLSEGLFGPMMGIVWNPAPMVYQAITYLYENFMEHWESAEFKLNLAQTNGNRRNAALLIGVRPYIAPTPLPNRVYIPPEGAELPDAPAAWYKAAGLKPPKSTSNPTTPTPVQETPPTQQPTHIVNTVPSPTPTAIIPEPWGDIELPIFS